MIDTINVPTNNTTPVITAINMADITPAIMQPKKALISVKQITLGFVMREGTTELNIR